MDLASVPLAQSRQGQQGGEENSGSHQKLSNPLAKRQKEILSTYHQKASVPICDQDKHLCNKGKVILQNTQRPTSPENLSGYTSCVSEVSASEYHIGLIFHILFTSTYRSE